MLYHGAPSCLLPDFFRAVYLHGFGMSNPMITKLCFGFLNYCDGQSEHTQTQVRVFATAMIREFRIDAVQLGSR